MDGYLASPSSGLSWPYQQYHSGPLPPYPESFHYERGVTPPPPIAGPSPLNPDLRGLECSKMLNFAPLQHHQNPAGFTLEGPLEMNVPERAPCVNYFPPTVHVSGSRDLREVFRKKANNARERMRVKSMNVEYKRLEKLSRKFVPMDKQPTRLQILKSTMDSIFTLERKLLGVNSWTQKSRERTTEGENEEQQAVATSSDDFPTQKIRKQSTSSSVLSLSNISYGTSPEDNSTATSYYDL